jgi:four helix bundle protein
MELAAEVYRFTLRLPREERFGLTAQLRKASVSVPSNIAEGWGRGATREYVQFLRYARGSLKELETQWLLAARVGFVPVDATRDLDRRSARVGKVLYRLVRALDPPRSA